MNADKTVDTRAPTSNPDPLTGEPGAHPLGTGIGAAAGGAAAGAAAGMVAGPIGAVVGAAVGGVVGGLAGKSMAEGIDPTVEHVYWRDNYASRDYIIPGGTFEDYGPAYAYGVSRYDPDLSFEDAETNLAEDWMGSRGASSLEWRDASHAARDAWDRLDSKGRPLD